MGPWIKLDVFCQIVIKGLNSEQATHPTPFMTGVDHRDTISITVFPSAQKNSPFWQAENHPLRYIGHIKTIEKISLAFSI